MNWQEQMKQFEDNERKRAKAEREQLHLQAEQFRINKMPPLRLSSYDMPDSLCRKEPIDVKDANAREQL